MSCDGDHLTNFNLVINNEYIFFTGEQEYLYQFTRLQLNWDGVDLSYYITYTTILSLLGETSNEE